MREAESPTFTLGGRGNAKTGRMVHSDPIPIHLHNQAPDFSLELAVLHPSFGFDLMDSVRGERFGTDSNSHF